MVILEKFGAASEKIARSFMPDPFVLVLLLTIIAFAIASWTMPFRPAEIVWFWNKGFWQLLNFSMQMVLIIATGEAIAEAELVQKLLKKICRQAKSAKNTVYVFTFFAMLLGWLHWGLGLIVSSLAARQLGKTFADKKINIHYPILGTAAYMSMLLWHAGTTASAPLLINTPGHFLYSLIGTIPLTETIFLRSNLVVCGVLLLFIPFLITQLMPMRLLKTYDQCVNDGDRNYVLARPSQEKPKTFAEKLERSYLTNSVIVVLGTLFLIKYFKNEGLNLNHNIINFLFIMIGLLLHKNPIEYSRAITKSVKGTAGIILQFPFYGGIMGIMSDSGLGSAIAHLFIQFSNAKTLPLFAYFSSVITKLFIPSGGGEWAVEGPVLLQAAKQLNAPIGLTTMGIAYGNMVGNLFQPFWAIPLLSIMGLKASQIMGYCLAIFCFAFPILAIALVLT